MLERASISRLVGLALDNRLDGVGSVVAVDAVMLMLVMLLRLCDDGSYCCCPCYDPAGVDIAAVVAMSNVCDIVWHC